MARKYIVIHHSATSPLATFRELEQAHLQRGFDGIGYHYLIDRDGLIIVGRPENREGAHALGMNKESLGVCCIGNFQESPLSEQQLEGLVEIVTELSQRNKIQISNIIGHCDVAELVAEATRTACPGKYLKELLPHLRERVDSRPNNTQQINNLRLFPDKQGIVKAEIDVLETLWESSKPAHQTAAMLFACLLDRENNVVWSNWLLSPQKTNFQSKLTTFTIRIPLGAVSPGPYAICIQKGDTLPRKVSPKEDTIVWGAIEFPITIPSSSTAYPYCAAVTSKVDRGRYAFLLNVSGRVTNVGTFPWRTDDEHTPFRIGALLFPHESTRPLITEIRYDFPKKTVECGETVPFRFSLNLLEYPPGDYLLHINLVKETVFWFSDKSPSGTTIPITIPSLSNNRHGGHTQLLSPVTSYGSDCASAHILYVAPTLPLFDRSTGGKRLFDLFKILRAKNIAVTFLYDHIGAGIDPARYLKALDQLGVNHSSDPLGFLASRQSVDYSICVIGWYSYASSVVSAIRAVIPTVRMAVDSIDIHWVRVERGLAANLSTTSAEDCQKEKQKEIDIYRLADEVWVISEDDQKSLATELPSVKTRVIGVPCSPYISFEYSSSSNRAVFLGGFNHPPNESAATWAAEIVLAYNSKYQSQPIYLDIIGANPPPSVLKLDDGKSISVLGYVPDLDPYLEKAAFLLAPLRYGAGVKGKVCEAICRGIPVVTNQIGNEGLNLSNNKEILLAETTTQFVDVISRIRSGSVDIRSMCQAALEKVLQKYGEPQIGTLLESAMVARPVVIVIVTYNQRELLRKCLYSVFENTSYPNYKIAVWSNGCTDGTVELLESLVPQFGELLEVHRSSSNDFFVKPCNQLIARYPTYDVVLMNNDVEVVNRGWLTNLYDAAYSTPTIASAGGKILDAAGRISEAGAEMYSSGFGANLLRGQCSDSLSAAIVRYVGFVSGCLMFMRRDAIDNVGPLDEDFHPMYFEDVAWHYKAHLKGWKTIYTPWAVAIHNEGSTAGTDINSGMKRYQETNRQKFLQKFSGITIEEFNE